MSLTPIFQLKPLFGGMVNNFLQKVMDILTCLGLLLTCNENIRNEFCRDSIFQFALKYSLLFQRLQNIILKLLSKGCRKSLCGTFFGHFLFNFQTFQIFGLSLLYLLASTALSLFETSDFSQFCLLTKSECLSGSSDCIDFLLIGKFLK